MSDKFRERLTLLRQELNKCVKPESFSCVPAVLVIGVTIPVIVWFFLYFLSPRFVLTEDDHGEKRIRSAKMIAFWTALITIFLWIVLFGLTFIESFNTGLACIFSS